MEFCLLGDCCYFNFFIIYNLKYNTNIVLEVLDFLKSLVLKIYLTNIVFIGDDSNIFT